MLRYLPVIVLILAAGRAAADTAPLTADQAVKLALQHNSQIIQAEANVLDARSGLWSAYSNVLPHASASLTRSGSFTRQSTGQQSFGTFVLQSDEYNLESYGTTQQVGGTWDVLDLGAYTGLSAARQSMRSAEFSREATRSNVAFATRQQFYAVVQAMHQSRVNSASLALARDSERRVRAMFEVGSVAKSDLLQAQVATGQAALDSVTAANTVLTQRIALAAALGLREAELAPVDSTFTDTRQSIDSAAVFNEARKNRADVLAAEADYKAAELSLRSAHWSRLPYVSLSGSWSPDVTHSSKYDTLSAGGGALGTASEAKGGVSGAVALNLDLFDGFLTDSRIAAARGHLVAARETRDALVRNLEGQVHQAILGYEQALEQEDLATTTVESATENHNLVLQKYNVGSATILDLVNSQVQLQTAQSSLVSAKAAIRIAEAQLDQVRGRSQ